MLIFPTPARKTADTVHQADSAKVDLVIDNVCPAAPNQFIDMIHSLIFREDNTHMSLGEMTCTGDCSVLQPLLMKAIIITQQNQYSQFLLGKGVGGLSCLR